MTEYIIIETDSGLTIVQQAAGDDPAKTATGSGGILSDAGPYASYAEVYEAMLSTPVNAEEGRD